MENYSETAPLDWNALKLTVKNIITSKQHVVYSTITQGGMYPGVPYVYIYTPSHSLISTKGFSI